MIKGDKVFEASSYTSLINKIKEGNYKLPQKVSREFISFLYGMLQYDGKFRLTAKQLLEKSFLRKNIKEFHYLSVNHDLKQQKEFLELKSSIKLFQEKMNNQSTQNNYQRQMTFEKKNPNPIQINNIPNNQINQVSYPNINRTINSNQTFSINNGFSFYGQKMIPDNESTNTSNTSSNIYSKTGASNHQNPTSHSYTTNTNFNINNPQNNYHRSMLNYNNIHYNINNTNNNNPQANNNSNTNPPLQRYNSQQIDAKKDDNCIVF
jgi:hypothetical protein